MNNNSILNTIKEMVGIEPTDTHFDVDVLVLINSAIVILNQLGVGNKGYKVTSATQTWGDFLGNMDELEMAKNYIYHRVRRTFDPPSSSYVMSAIEDDMREMEWRLNVAVDHGGEDE